MFQQHLKDASVPLTFILTVDSHRCRQAEILITTPFHPGYLTRELVEKVRAVLVRHPFISHHFGRRRISKSA